MVKSADYSLGERLAGHLIDVKAPTEKLISGLLQDLMGEDQSLLPPLQDLLAKPAFKQAIRSKKPSNSEVFRDSLLIELSQIYNLQIINRLNEFLKGYLEYDVNIQPGSNKSMLNQNQNTYSKNASKFYEEPTVVQQSSPITRESISSGLKSELMSQQPYGHASFDPRQGEQANKILLLLAGVAVGGLLVGITALATFHLQKPKKLEISPQKPQDSVETEIPKSTSPVEVESTLEVRPSIEERITGYYISEAQAKSIVLKWLNSKSQIFAPPFNLNLASEIISKGPLWTDLTRPNGSIDWLKKYNRYYTYPTIRLNKVISFKASTTMPSIVVSIREISILHTPNGKKTSNDNYTWIYTLKKENSFWKIWDYKRKTT